MEGEVNEASHQDFLINVYISLGKKTQDPRTVSSSLFTALALNEL